MSGDEQNDLDLQLRAAFHDLPDTQRVELSVRKRIVEERLRRRPSVTAGVAAGILLTGFGYWAMKEHPAPRLFSDAAHDHQAEVIDHKPRRWRSSEADIAILTAQYGMPNAALAGFARAGYRLEHAKTCGLEGRAVLHLVYANGSSEFSAYIRRRGDRPLPGNAIAVGTEHVAAFQTKGFDAVIVTGGSSADCLKLAEQLRSVI